MERIITISWDSCELNPKCEGCYIETLKKKKELKSDLPDMIYTIFDKMEENRHNIADINVNISDRDDWGRYKEITNATESCGDTRVRVIFPPYLADPKDMKGIPKFTIKCISVNTWYFPATVLITNNMLNHLKHLDNVEVELSFNPETIMDDNIVGSLTDALNKAEKKVSSVLINYVNNGGLNPRQLIARAYYIKSLLNPPIDVIISPCIEAGVGFSAKPCQEYQSYDFIDGKLMAKGCPFGGTESCLK